MSFVGKLAKGGLFGLGGMAAHAILKKDKKPTPSLVASSRDTSTIDPSLINRKSIY